MVEVQEAPKPQAATPEGSARRLLREEIDLQQQDLRKQSVLSLGLTAATGTNSDSDTVSRLHGYSNRSAGEMLSAIATNRNRRDWEESIAEYAPNFLKTACLFIPGKAGYIASAVVYGLDEIKPSSSVGEMVLDGSLGVAKGLGTKKFLDWSQTAGWSTGVTGVYLGQFTRLTDSALTRSTYLSSDGKLDVANGLEKVAIQTFNPLAMAMDYGVFRASHGMLDKLSTATAGRISNTSAIWRAAVTGESLGLTGGFTSEAWRQYQDGKFDPARLATVTVTRGLLDGTAAALGTAVGVRSVKFDNPFASGQLPAKDLPKLDSKSRTESLDPRMTLRRPTIPDAQSAEFRFSPDGPLLSFTSPTHRLPVPAERISLRPALGETREPDRGRGRNTEGQPASDDMHRVAGIPRETPTAGRTEPLNGRPMTNAGGGDGLSLAELHKLLGEPVAGKDYLPSLQDGPRIADHEPRSWEAANLTTSEIDVNVYRYGNTDIVVPKDYDAQLGGVRKWRLANGEKPMPDTHAQKHLEGRVLPEELIPALRASLKPDEVRLVRLLDSNNPRDRFVNQTNPDFISAMTASPEGELNLYRLKHSELMHEDILHDVLHIAKWKMPRDSARFDLAAKLEENGYFVRDYAREPEENWSVHMAEELANPNLARATTFARLAPLRASAQLLTLQDMLAQTNRSDWTSRHLIVERNINQLLEPTLDSARKSLIETVRSADPTRADLAARLLLDIGRSEDLAALPRIRSIDFSGEPNSTAIAVSSLLDKLPQLGGGVENLNLSGADLSGDNVSGIASIKGLTGLSLKLTNLSNFGLNGLRANRSITNLDLSGNWRISGEAARTLEQMPQLRQLDVSNTGFTPEDVAALRILLPNTTIIH